MGAGLIDFLAPSGTTVKPNRIPAKNIKLPKSNIIGAVLVPKGTLPDIGSATTFTPPGGSAVAITTSNLVSILTILALNGIATVFPNRTITGKRAAFVADEEAAVFGSQAVAEDTGEGTITYDIMYKHAYYNTEFMNKLRLESGVYDIYFFTDRSVEVVRADVHEYVFKNTKNGEIVGANNSNITNGGFQVVARSEGDIVPEIGLFEQGLSQSNFRFTFAQVAATGTGLTASLSGTFVTKTNSGSGTITAAINETIQTGVATYRLYNETGAALPANVTIDSTTGVITVGASVVAGTYKLIKAVENATGITGQVNFTLIAQ